MHCGRSTAAGSALFSGRKRAIDTTTGAEGVLCHACQPGSAAPGAKHTVPLSGRYVVGSFPGGGPQSGI
jgi:hypothetical protein